MNKKTPSVWLGKEVEGYYSGLKTLFIGSKKIIYGEIENYVHDYDVQQIYFGAGGCTDINYDTVRSVVDKISNVKITLELDINDLHKIPNDVRVDSRINFILTHTHKDYHLMSMMKKRNIQIKLQTIPFDKYLTVGSLYHFSETNMDKHEGETYKGDRVIKW